MTLSSAWGALRAPLFLLINVCARIALAALLAWWTWHWLAPTPRPLLVPSGTVDQMAVARIGDAHWFGQRQVEAGPVDLQLVGILNRDGAGVAIIHVPGADKAVLAGQAIDANDRLVGLGERQAVVDHQGERMTLSLHPLAPTLRLSK